MNPHGICVQVEHASFGSTKGSGLQINDVVIVHGMILTPLCVAQDDDKDPIQKLGIIMKDILNIQSCTQSRNLRSIPIKFKVLTKTCSCLSKNKIGSTPTCCSSSESVEEAKVCSLYTYRGLQDITNEIYNWTDNNTVTSLDIKLVDRILPVFIIMMVNKPSKFVGFEKTLYAQYSEIRSFNLYPGLPLLIESTPFGNLSLVNSWSQGIVSKVIGSRSDGIITDARLVPGCEGAPIYSFEKGIKGPLVGIVIQTLAWCSGERVGFSLGLSAQQLLKDILGLQAIIDYIPISKSKLEISNALVNMDDLSDAVVFVRCQNKWGSGVVIDAASGLILTCSHIVNHAHDSVKVLFKNGKVEARVIYASPPSTPYDLALLSVGEVKGLKQLQLADSPPVLGEKVLTVGYPLSTENLVAANRTPTLTAGCVAKLSQRGGPIQTTCCTHGGVSGGALLRPPSQLLGIVVSNLQCNKVIMSSFNFAISVEHFRTPFREYLVTKDPSCLQSLSVNNTTVKMEWALPDCKL
uniref:Peroxisomal leader peptide-processing protease n=1 Tax=Homalodisca liturata TaxID=320908 RepID=A0A1B6JAH7_9HEMI